MNDGERLQMRVCSILLSGVREALIAHVPGIEKICEPSGELFAIGELAEVLDAMAEGDDVTTDLRALASALDTEQQHQPSEAGHG